MLDRKNATAATAAMNPLLKTVLNKGPDLVKNKTLINMAAKMGRKFIVQNGQERLAANPDLAPGIVADQTALGLAMLESIRRALTGRQLSDATYDKASNILGKDLLIEKSQRLAKMDAFQEKFGIKQPSFVLISPTKACNLRCKGCYADSDERVTSLSWDTVSRIIAEARELWGVQFTVVSGGEPMAYRSQGKTLLDLAEKHSNNYFMFYTNGTLVDDEAAQRMAELGNIVPMISLEGWREQTDARRGEGIFDKACKALDRLYDAGVLYGVSLTPTRENADILMSEEFIDFIFFEKHAAVAWLFQYMPIGRSFTLDLMPTPQQRLRMWQQSWRFVREKKVFIADFWNSGTAVDGCLSAGGHGNGGYFYIDWNGNVNPCVFVPYSPVNINDIYAQSKTLDDVFMAPFFQDLRHLQSDLNQKTQGKNTINPCPIRDHNPDFLNLIRKHEPMPTDINAQAALLDPEYAKGMAEYGASYQQLVDVIWEEIYKKDNWPANEDIEEKIRSLSMTVGAEV
ncbi:MAG: radical SAM/SPASM domain-containing protein [Chloroflexota bacterium]|nr:radical SAM/SPASM domain-containing protein [Chloroflexota bacterium]